MGEDVAAGLVCVADAGVAVFVDTGATVFVVVEVPIGAWIPAAVG
jgi:hypothetical protein